MVKPKENTLLQFIDFQLVENWSVQYLKGTTFSYNKNFDLVNIGDFLIKNLNTIEIEDSQEYRRVTVKMNNKGVTLRDTEIGKNIGTKRQFEVAGGEFIMSKIDARNGAFGIVPHELSGAIVTNDFPTYHIDQTKLNPDFFVLLTSTSEFLGFAQMCSSGTTGRQRVSMDQFLKVKIPLPSLLEQNRIVEAYQKNILQAEMAQEKSQELETEIERYLMEELGIETVEKKKEKELLHFIDFKELNIWAIWGVNIAFISNAFESRNLGNVLNIKSGNFLPNSKQVQGDYNVYGGNGINGLHNEYNCEGDRIVIGRVGEKCGNIHLVTGSYWVTDNAFITDLLDKSYNLNYLYLVLQILDLNQFKVVSAQPSLSQKNINNIPIPLPPLEIQNKIVEHIGAMKEEIQHLRGKSEDLRESAKRAFEEEIFSI